mmetsp:Transcript_28438/g.53742  ORF Transcript_28438/g.53742 Transcript_28438/m.53742 type:complete len:84 (-) Transcript_28438:272-523(-)
MRGEQGGGGEAHIGWEDSGEFAPVGGSRGINTICDVWRRVGGECMPMNLCSERTTTKISKEKCACLMHHIIGATGILWGGFAR